METSLKRTSCPGIAHAKNSFVVTRPSLHLQQVTASVGGDAPSISDTPLYGGPLRTLIMEVVQPAHRSVSRERSHIVVAVMAQDQARIDGTCTCYPVSAGKR